MSPSYELSPSDRSRVDDGVDPDALERFLAAVPDEIREEVLHSFLSVSSGSPEPAFLVDVRGDPALERLYREVWTDRRQQDQIRKSQRSKADTALSAMIALVDMLDEPSAIGALRRDGEGRGEWVILLPQHGSTGKVLAECFTVLDELVRRSDSSSAELPRYVFDTARNDALPDQLQPYLQDQYRQLDLWLDELRDLPERRLEGLGKARVRTYQLRS